MTAHDSIFRERRRRKRASRGSVRRIVGWPLAALSLLLIVIALLKLIDV